MRYPSMKRFATHICVRPSITIVLSVLLLHHLGTLLALLLTFFLSKGSLGAVLGVASAAIGTMIPILWFLAVSVRRWISHNAVTLYNEEETQQIQDGHRLPHITRDGKLQNASPRSPSRSHLHEPDIRSNRRKVHARVPERSSSASVSSFPSQAFTIPSLRESSVLFSDLIADGNHSDHTDCDGQDTKKRWHTPFDQRKVSPVHAGDWTPSTAPHNLLPCNGTHYESWAGGTTPCGLNTSLRSHHSTSVWSFLCYSSVPCGQPKDSHIPWCLGENGLVLSITHRSLRAAYAQQNYERAQEWTRQFHNVVLEALVQYGCEPSSLNAEVDASSRPVLASVGRAGTHHPARLTQKKRTGLRETPHADAQDDGMQGPRWEILDSNPWEALVFFWGWCGKSIGRGTRNTSASSSNEDQESSHGPDDVVANPEKDSAALVSRQSARMACDVAFCVLNSINRITETTSSHLVPAASTMNPWTTAMENRHNLGMAIAMGSYSYYVSHCATDGGAAPTQGLPTSRFQEPRQQDCESYEIKRGKGEAELAPEPVHILMGCASVILASRLSELSLDLEAPLLITESVRASLFSGDTKGDYCCAYVDAVCFPTMLENERLLISYVLSLRDVETAKEREAFREAMMDVEEGYGYLEQNKYAEATEKIQRARGALPVTTRVFTNGLVDRCEWLAELYVRTRRTQVYQRYFVGWEKLEGPSSVPFPLMSGTSRVGKKQSGRVARGKSGAGSIQVFGSTQRLNGGDFSFPSILSNLCSTEGASSNLTSPVLQMQMQAGRCIGETIGANGQASTYVHHQSIVSVTDVEYLRARFLSRASLCELPPGKGCVVYEDSLMDDSNFEDEWEESDLAPSPQSVTSKLGPTTKVMKPRMRNTETNEEKLICFSDKKGRAYQATFRHVIGCGGFARVLLGMAEDGSLVAVKVVTLSEGTHKYHTKRIAFDALVEEVSVLSSLRHTNIVSYHGSALDNARARLLIVMEYISGGTLASIVAEFGPINMLSSLRRYCRDILNGLIFLHSKGIVHCDIKPQNVLVTIDGTCKLTDFGTSRVIGSLRSGEDDGDLVGTPAYMAPEQCRGEQCTPASDVWSFGIMAVELATGCLPWNVTGFAPATFIYRLGKGWNMQPDVPDSLDPKLKAMIERCLVRDVNARATISELLAGAFLSEV